MAKKMVDVESLLEKLSEIIVLSEHEQKLIQYYVNGCMAVDAVEVVRCKDCRYCQSDTLGLWCFNDYEHSLQPNDFCSYGERRSDD